MSQTLTRPRIVRSYFVGPGSRPRLPVLSLEWDEVFVKDRPWRLPGGLCVWGPPPQQFGLSVRSRGRDSHVVRLFWNQTHLTWRHLSRDELLGSCLNELLAALGADLWCMLDPLMEDEPCDPESAA